MPSSPFDHPHRKGRCYATWFAKRKSFELVGHFGFTESDREDNEQQLLVSLMQRWPKFNSAECTPNEFISWAIGVGIRDLVREQQNRNEFLPTECEPLEDLLGDEEELLPASCVHPDHAPAVELSVDLAEVLARLPSEVQYTAQLLVHNNICDVARELGLSRRTIRNRVQVIREALEAAGYGTAMPHANQTSEENT